MHSYSLSQDLSGLPDMLTDIALPTLPIPIHSSFESLQKPDLASKTIARYNFEFLHSDQFLEVDDECDEEYMDLLLSSIPSLPSTDFEYSSSSSDCSDSSSTDNFHLPIPSLYSAVPDLVPASYQSATSHTLEEDTDDMSISDFEDAQLYDSEMEEVDNHHLGDDQHSCNSYDEFNAEQLDRVFLQEREAQEEEEDDLVKLKLIAPTILMSSSPSSPSRSRDSSSNSFLLGAGPAPTTMSRK